MAVPRASPAATPAARTAPGGAWAWIRTWTQARTQTRTRFRFVLPLYRPGRNCCTTHRLRALLCPKCPFLAPKGHEDPRGPDTGFGVHQEEAGRRDRVALLGHGASRHGDSQGGGCLHPQTHRCPWDTGARGRGQAGQWHMRVPDSSILGVCHQPCTPPQSHVTQATPAQPQPRGWGVPLPPSAPPDGSVPPIAPRAPPYPLYTPTPLHPHLPV